MPMRLNRQQFLRLSLAGIVAPFGLACSAFAFVAVGAVAKIKGTASLSRDGQQKMLRGGEEVAAGDVVTPGERLPHKLLEQALDLAATQAPRPPIATA